VATSPGAIWWCGVNGMSGMGTSHGDLPGAVLAAMPMWMAMCAAMMLPVGLIALRRLAPVSSSALGHAGAAGFATGYLAVWCAYGVLVLSLAAVLATAAWPSLVGALTLAAGWQLSASKRRFLEAAASPVVLAPAGGRRFAGTLTGGARRGAACLGSCWAIMLVMAEVASEQLLWMVALSALVVLEHRSWHRQRVLVCGAVSFAAAALIALLVAG